MDEVRNFALNLTGANNAAANTAEEAVDDESIEDDPEIGNYETPEEREKLRKKIGTKKLLKLEAKAEKRSQNEVC